MVFWEAEGVPVWGGVWGYPPEAGFSSKKVRTLSSRHRQFEIFRFSPSRAIERAETELKSATSCQGFLKVTANVFSATLRFAAADASAKRFAQERIWNRFSARASSGILPG